MRIGLHILAVFGLMIGSCGGEEDTAPDPEDLPQPPARIPNEAPLGPGSTLEDCEDGTVLTYENFGEAFLLDNCTMCHSDQMTGDERGGAPTDVDFNTIDLARYWRAEMIEQATGNKPKMPPSTHIDKTTRARFEEWLACGAPGVQDQLPD